jgi:hypothetical protein
MKRRATRPGPRPRSSRAAPGAGFPRPPLRRRRNRCGRRCRCGRDQAGDDGGPTGAGDGGHASLAAHGRRLVRGGSGGRCRPGLRRGRGRGRARLSGRGQGRSHGRALGPPLGLAAKGIGMGLKTAGRALGFFNPENVGNNLQLRNLERDNLTPAAVADRMNAPEYAGAPMIVPDAAGRNTVNLASSVANMPGRGMDVAEKVADLRRAGGPERMQEAARSEFGGGFGDARDPRLTLEMERGTNAPPLYEQSYQEGIPREALPRAAEFMADPIGQEALQRGLRTIELEHLARGEPFVPELYGVRRATPQESGNAPQPYSRPAGMSPSPAAVEAGADASNPVQVAGRWVIPENSVPNMRLLDAVKQGYDEIVNGLRDPRTGIVQSDRYIRAVDDSRRAFRDHLAEANPTYGEALARHGRDRHRRARRCALGRRRSASPPTTSWRRTRASSTRRMRHSTASARATAMAASSPIHATCRQCAQVPRGHRHSGQAGRHPARRGARPSEPRARARDADWPASTTPSTRTRARTRSGWPRQPRTRRAGPTRSARRCRLASEAAPALLP